MNTWEHAAVWREIAEHALKRRDTAPVVTLYMWHVLSQFAEVVAETYEMQGNEK